MNFRETLHELYDETKETTIFAMNSYGNGSIGIGFRRQCCGSDLKDPIIDDIPFMLYADAWNEALDEPIEKTYDLWFAPNENVQIRLRADSGTYPSTTINLGSYKVVRKMLEAVEDSYTMSGVRKIPARIRLDIVRV